MFVCLFVCVFFFCSFVCLFVCAFVCLFLSFFVSLFVCARACVCVCVAVRVGVSSPAFLCTRTAPTQQRDATLKRVVKALPSTRYRHVQSNREPKANPKLNTFLDTEISFSRMMRTVKVKCASVCSSAAVATVRASLP